VFADFGCARMDVTKASDNMAAVGASPLKRLHPRPCMEVVVLGRI
jgi:hypothetical protein